MKKPKLLVTASTFPRWNGDTEPRFVLDLCMHLADYFDVTVLVPAAPGAKEKETLNGKVKVIRYHYFPIHRWETLCYPGAVIPRIREKKIRALLLPFLLVSFTFHLGFMLPGYDIVHAHWLLPQGVMQSFFHKPYIVTGHGADVTSFNKGIIRKLKIRCLKRAGYVTAVSGHLKKKMQELVPQIQPKVISMGVHTRQFGDRFRVPDYFGQRNRKVVLYVGRLAEKKGVSYLLEAMKQVNAMLVIVGDGPMRKKLKKQASEIKNSVRFLGTKTHRELKTIYASADLLVCPSVTAKDGDQEGLPLVLMEAMASGLPVVASDSGGIAQMIKHEVNGLLCQEKDVIQLADNMNRILEDIKFSEQLRENAKKTVLVYDYDKIGEQYARILELLLHDRKSLLKNARGREK